MALTGRCNLASQPDTNHSCQQWPWLAIATQRVNPKQTVVAISGLG